MSNDQELVVLREFAAALAAFQRDLAAGKKFRAILFAGVVEVSSEEDEIHAVSGGSSDAVVEVLSYFANTMVERKMLEVWKGTMQ